MGHFCICPSLTVSVTTECVLNELESLGGALYGALVIAKRFKTRKCGHCEHIPATECVSHLVGMYKLICNV